MIVLALIVFPLQLHARNLNPQLAYSCQSFLSPLVATTLLSACCLRFETTVSNAALNLGIRYTSTKYPPTIQV